MIYLKSFLVGLLALVLATLIALGLVFASMVIMVRIQPPAGGISFDIGAPWIPLWLLGAVAVSIFAAAFYWEFHKIRQLRG
jgi:hypothetical protein